MQDSKPVPSHSTVPILKRPPVLIRGLQSPVIRECGTRPGGADETYSTRDRQAAAASGGGELAKECKSRGIKLNYPEAIALISSECVERA